MITQKMVDKIEMELNNLYEQKRFIATYRNVDRPADREIRVFDKKNKYITRLIIYPVFRDENNKKIVSLLRSHKLGQLVVDKVFARSPRVPMVATKKMLELTE